MVERRVGERIVAHGGTYPLISPLQKLLKRHVRLLCGIPPQFSPHKAVKPFRGSLGKTVGQRLKKQCAIIIPLRPQDLTLLPHINTHCKCPYPVPVTANKIGKSRKSAGGIGLLTAHCRYPHLCAINLSHYIITLRTCLNKIDHSPAGRTP